MRRAVVSGFLSLSLVSMIGIFGVMHLHIGNFGYMESIHDMIIKQNISERLLDELQEVREQDVSFELEQRIANHSHRYELEKLYIPLEQGNSPIRLLCLVLTSPNNYVERAQAVFDTWGQRCTFLYFLSTKSSGHELGLPVIHNPKEENYAYLWSKTKFGFDFAFQHLMNQVDWVLKADDDTYVIMENMHNMLAQHSPDDPIWFGSMFSVHANPGYFSGGSGYVLSRAAVQLLGPKLNDETICRGDDSGSEDVEMGKCLVNLGVQFINTRPEGEETFFPLPVWETLSISDEGHWYMHYKNPPPVQGFECCSSAAVSFHYINWPEMYLLDYWIYKVRVASVAEIAENYEKTINGSNVPWPTIAKRPE